MTTKSNGWNAIFFPFAGMDNFDPQPYISWYMLVHPIINYIPYVCWLLAIVDHWSNGWCLDSHSVVGHTLLGQLLSWQLCSVRSRTSSWGTGWQWCDRKPNWNAEFGYLNDGFIMTIVESWLVHLQYHTCEDSGFSSFNREAAWRGRGIKRRNTSDRFPPKLCTMISHRPCPATTSNHLQPRYRLLSLLGHLQGSSSDWELVLVVLTCEGSNLVYQKFHN